MVKLPPDATVVQHAFTAPDLTTQSEPNVFGGCFRECFSCRKALLPV